MRLIGLRKNRLRLFFLAAIVVSSIISASGQNCEVDFPGTASRHFSSSCGGSSSGNLKLGKNTPLGDGDVFTFDGTTININGNVEINAQGSGKIIIPAGVTVNVDGNFDLKSENGGCTSSNPCSFEIIVLGTLNLSSHLHNNLFTLLWSGTGTVTVDDHFENRDNACMNCGAGGCPNFNVDPSHCEDKGSSCGGGDFCSQISMCASDNIKPVITGCPPNIVLSTSVAGCTQIANWTAPIATDNCSLASFTPSHTPGSAFPKGITTVSYTAKDTRGNTSTCSFTVTVIDDVAPVITGCPANITLNANASCQALGNWTPPNFTDNCAGATISSTKTPGSLFDIGVTTVIYTATDVAGNTATCSFNVTVVDNIAPVITGCPTNIVVNADERCEAIVNWSAPVSVGACADVTFESSHQPGNAFPIGTTQVTYTFSIDGGQAATCIFTVTVKDTTPPVVTGPSTVVEAAGSTCTKRVNFTAPVIIDCSTFNVVSTHLPGDEFGIGVTPVSYTATDLAGNSTTFTFDIIVEDKTGPVFQDCPANITINATSCTAIANWTKPTATDNCGTVTVTSTHESGSTFPPGNTNITYTAVDDAGNISTCTFTLTVEQKVPPIFENCPIDIHLEGDDDNIARAEWMIPTARALCGDVKITSSHLPGDIFNVGTTTVEYQAIDDAGNVAYCRFNVIVSPIEIDIDVAKVITPDGDGQNDLWILKNIEKFKDNKVVVVDRWGGIIFMNVGYNNGGVVWQGKSRSGNFVPTGTYFYSISVRVGSRNVKKSGAIEVVR